MNESKTDRFRRVAEARVNKIIKMIRLLGNCSGTGVYEYTDTQAAYIFSALQSELDKAKKRFRKPSLGKHRFSLTDTNEFDDDRPLEPTIALALPDGSYLRAVVYEDDQVIAFDDLNPQAPVHTLVIPKKHYSDIADNVPTETMGAMAHAIQEVAKAKGLEDGFRVISNKGVNAGQTVMHFHMHVLGGKNLGENLI